jgi:hypothetical protein
MQPYRCNLHLWIITDHEVDENLYHNRIDGGLQSRESKDAGTAL